MNRTRISDLERYFRNNPGRLIHKWNHYFDIYERHFSRFRGQEIAVLEIGVYHGGSLQMWKDYFGDKAEIYGLDINPDCKQFEEENIEIFIGSQSDRSFLRELKEKIPKVDILIDDGGHRMDQQIISYEELFDHVKSDGIYLCEDLHTSYWPEFGGGYGKPDTFVEYAKKFIDELNAFHFTAGHAQCECLHEVGRVYSLLRQRVGYRKVRKETIITRKDRDRIYVTRRAKSRQSGSIQNPEPQPLRPAATKVERHFQRYLG